ncbi:MAG TPA: zinc ribbon domain-containing protein, partial [Desulfobacterales bacterium]|nr:zinc ribbon domain-containing protein [Desulfobacterales bacterium]
EEEKGTGEPAPGETEIVTEAPPRRVCAGPEHHEMPPGAKFCPECGAQLLVEEAPPRRVCAGPEHHEMPPEAKFCPECGQPPLAEGETL